MKTEAAAPAVLEAKPAVTRRRCDRIAPLSDLFNRGLKPRSAARRRAAEFLPDVKEGAR